MDKEVLYRLRAMKPRFSDMNIRRLAVFGSQAKGTEQSGSDVDLLVEFSKPVDYFEFFEKKKQFEDILGRKVDLVTFEAAQKVKHNRILKDAIDV